MRYTICNPLVDLNWPQQLSLCLSIFALPISAAVQTTPPPTGTPEVPHLLLTNPQSPHLASRSTNALRSAFARSHPWKELLDHTASPNQTPLPLPTSASAKNAA